MAMFTAHDALEMAMTIEKNGRAFYTAAAAKMAQPGLKRLFEELAIQEERHYAAYQSLAARPSSSVDTPIEEYDEYQVYLQGAMDSAMITEPDKALAIVERATDPQTILQAALGFEKDSLLFFYDLRDMVDEADRETVQAIIQEEKAHVRRLSKGQVSPEFKNWWKCSLCNYTLQAEQPPQVCPGCNRKCAFIDVTCYTAECEPGQPNPQLMGTR
jgi:rubrerythrin/rubredoxin